MTPRPSFPPLMQGINAAGADPFEAACIAAAQGVDAGTILYDVAGDTMRAAVVLAPEVPLREAAVMLPLTGIALQNALGALGPAELAVQLDWSGPLRVNGAHCGTVRCAADSADRGAVPGWLVTGITVVRHQTHAGGETPDRTALSHEGCGELDPLDLLESWSRHLLNWISRWEADGVAPVHRDYAGLVHGMGARTKVLGRTGTFLGLDETLGLVLKSNGATTVLPLTDLLETRS